MTITQLDGEDPFPIAFLIENKFTKKRNLEHFHGQRVTVTRYILGNVRLQPMVAHTDGKLIAEGRTHL